MRPTPNPNPLQHKRTQIAVLRGVFRTVGTVAPPVAARLAEAVFCRPPRPALRPMERTFLGEGRRFTVANGREPLVAWSWGEGPTVIAVHGWGSTAGRFSAIAPPLVAAGYRVVAYDNPAHGASPGARSSMPQFADALAAVARATGPVHALVGHSLGGATIPFAMSRGLEASRAVLIAAPADPASFSHRFAQLLALPEPARSRMQQNLETRFRLRWQDLHIPTLAARLATPALVIHDADDHDVLLDDAHAIVGAWPGARLLVTRGLGHRAVLRSDEVVAAVTRFVTGRDAADTPRTGPDVNAADVTV